MAKTEIDRAVQQSLLDRLTDELPRESSDRTTNRDSSARSFRASVQRDVEWLLNTRRTVVQTTDDHPQVAQSVHQFGLPDVTGFYLSAVSSRERLSEAILDTIRRFEPRLANVQVKLNDLNDGHVPQVRFSISATLLMDPSPEQILFDTVLQVATGVYEVGEEG